MSEAIASGHQNAVSRGGSELEIYTTVRVNARADPAVNARCTR